MIFTARDLTKGTQIQNKLREKTKNKSITCEHLDLEDFKSVQIFSSTFNKKIDVLVNNAGIFYHPPQETTDGFDITFQTNYLGKQVENFNFTNNTSNFYLRTLSLN